MIATYWRTERMTSIEAAQAIPFWDYENEIPGGAGWYRIGMLGPTEVSWDGPFSTRRIAEGK